MLLRSIILRVSSRPWFERFIKRSRLTRRVVRRFVAGDTLEEAMTVAEGLASEGFHVTLDLLGEHTVNSQQADSACDEYIAMLRRIAQSKHRGSNAPERINISIKLTQLGLLQGGEATMRRLHRLLQTAADTQNFVRVDMEDSGCTQATLDAIAEGHAAFGNVGAVLQSMLLRTTADLAWLIERRIRVRLVKGAYLEGADVAYQSKAQVDGSYRELAGGLVRQGVYPAFGTHDAKLIDEVCKLATNAGIEKTGYEFQMLYGIQRDLQAKLRREGHHVRVYVPYGSSWYPYFSRRLAERPANLLFFIKSLFSR